MNVHIMIIQKVVLKKTFVGIQMEAQQSGVILQIQTRDLIGVLQLITYAQGTVHITEEDKLKQFLVRHASVGIQRVLMNMAIYNNIQKVVLKRTIVGIQMEALQSGVILLI
jgi:hypothetical protein